MSPTFVVLPKILDLHFFIVTERVGHAFDAMASITNLELNLYDGVLAIELDEADGKSWEIWLSERNRINSERMKRNS
ncbi:hypothetical protein L1987_60022 [Smallanthus sonchifolius]|uniref:Uncharacterized protein n=1 Tax=Smallanthus sonchifolius TaxID=185202 RepID=A0ACB9D6Z0_9ASTR|nr:hypothetical protein L1987_60022 [Smallanthus sonchifolius]